MASKQNQIKLDTPDVLVPIFITDKRFICLYGGRGSSKSWTVAQFLLLKGIEKKCRILCTREIQTSIKDSVHKLLSDQIEALGISDRYIIQRDSIIGINGTEFIFKGLHRNDQDVKSTEGIEYELSTIYPNNAISLYNI